MLSDQYKNLDQRKNITQVSAQKGVFDLEKDRAFGSEKINIDGSGFRLEGEHWKWQQDQEGRHNFKIGKEGFAFENYSVFWSFIFTQKTKGGFEDIFQALQT